VSLLAAPFDPDSVSAGPLGFLNVLVMLVVTVLLIRNMSARIKRLPREFPDDRPREGDS
jgi:hypothetical protein